MSSKMIASPDLPQYYVNRFCLYSREESSFMTKPAAGMHAQLITDFAKAAAAARSSAFGLPL